MTELSTLPQMPRLLAGFLHLEGSALPVLRLSQLFKDANGAKSTSEPDGIQNASLQNALYSHLIRIRTHSEARRPHPYVLWVDRVREVRSFLEADLLPIGIGHTFNDCITVIAEEAGGNIHFLDLDRLLLKEERVRIAMLQAQAQERLRELEPGSDLSRRATEEAAAHVAAAAETEASL